MITMPAFDNLLPEFAEAARRLVEILNFETMRAKLDMCTAEIAAAFESIRIADESRMRSPRSWPVRLERRPADVPRRVSWTASLRAFA